MLCYDLIPDVLMSLSAAAQTIKKKSWQKEQKANSHKNRMNNW